MFSCDVDDLHINKRFAPEEIFGMIEFEPEIYDLLLEIFNLRAELNDLIAIGKDDLNFGGRILLPKASQQRQEVPHITHQRGKAYTACPSAGV